MSKCAIGDCYVEREDAIEVLRRARDAIFSGRSTYICLECEAIGQLMPELSNAERAIRWWVRDMLGECFSYNTWVERRHPDFARAGREHNAYVQRAREGRLAWIDWMIAELRK